MRLNASCLLPTQVQIIKITNPDSLDGVKESGIVREGSKYGIESSVK